MEPTAPPRPPAPHPARAWWVCGVLLLATCLNYLDRQALAVTLPGLNREFALGERRVGLLEGYFGFAFAAGSVVFGLVADRFGPRRLYPVVLAGWSLAGVATGFAGRADLTGLLERPGDDPGAGTFRWLLICRTVLGVFEAGHWPCALVTVQRLLAPADRPLGNGILQSGVAVASVVIPLYAQLVEVQGGGWPVVFWSVGGVGLLWVPLWLAVVGRDDLVIRDAAPRPADGPAPAGPPGRLAFARRLIALGLVIGCLNISWQFLRAWLPLLLEFSGYDRWGARQATAGFFVAAEVGCLAAGALVRRLARRGWAVPAARVATYTAFAALAAVAAAVPFVDPGPGMIAGLLVAGAGILGLHPVYYAFTQDVSARRMGVTFGGLAAAGWVMSGVFQILIGARIQETRSYDTALVVAGLAPLAGLAALVVIRPRDGRG